MSAFSHSSQPPLSSSAPIVRVAVSVPLRALFDYLPPINFDSSLLQPGMRLLVPFGKSQRVAVITDLLSHSEIDPSLLKPVDRVLDERPWLSPADLQFLKWVAAYYQHPAGEVILSALPTHLRKGEEAVDTTEAAWVITPAGREVLPQLPANVKSQKALLAYFESRAAPVGRDSIKAHFGKLPPALKTLDEKGWIKKLFVPQLQVEAGSHKAESLVLNEEQQQAIDSVTAQQGFAVSLLHGITGSGKTEVYLGIANQVLEQGRQVLILVPEIALTPQLLQRLRSRICQPMVVLHSGLSDRQRCAAWQQAAVTAAKVVVGTRSAVFTPLPDAGLIIVDEEHDLSFKQQEGFRYSARDMAVARGKHLNCAVVLGSATPGFESLQNAERGVYRYLQLKQRAGNAKLPAMELVDIRSVRMEAGISPVTRRLIDEQLQQGQQVMVFLNRRGFAPVLTCHDCGWVGHCHRCDANMTVHARHKRLWCHHCGHQQKLPEQCPDCNSTRLTTLGQGTEKLESVLNDYFPDVDCVRIDHDTTRRKGSMQDKLDMIRSGKSRLLIGTQMLAKGHDFPGVTLVVMLDIDHGLFGTDFRASERMAQQLIQVAGRAGRGDKPGRVLIQTRHPEHPLLQLLISRGYSEFSRQAMQERQQAAFPPFSYQVLVRAEATDAGLPESFLREAVKTAQTVALPGPEFWGPVPAIMQKKAGQHRFHLLLQSTSRRALHLFLDQWLELLQKLPAARKVRWSVDVDPQDFYS